MVMLGAGDATFATSWSIASQGQPNGMAVADFNRDGRPDVAASQPTSNTVRFFSGLGNGTFSANGSASGGTGAGPAGLAAGHLDTDGRVDVVFARASTGTVGVLYNSTRPLAVANSYAADEDGMLSVPASSGVLVNDSDGAVAAVLVAGPAHAAAFTLNSDGSFIYVPAPDYFGIDTFTYKAGDGAALSAAAATVTIAVAGVNDAPVPADDAFAGGGGAPLTGNVLANDVDVDGQVISASLLARPLHGTVVLAADGSFTYTAAADYRGADHFSYLASDGVAPGQRADVTLTVTGPAVAGGDLNFLTFQKPYLEGTIPGLRGAITGDFNGDGFTDIAYGWDGGIGFTFSPLGPARDSRAIGRSTVWAFGAIAAADFNNDGKDELVAAQTLGTKNYLDTFSAIDGMTSPAVQFIDVSSAALPTAMSVGDFNHDGFLDVAAYNDADGSVRVFLNNHSGNFTAGVSFALRPGLVDFTAGDFDGDGATDLAALDRSAGSLVVALCGGNGTFGAGTSFAAGAGALSMAGGDFNSDGVFDFAVGTASGSLLLMAGDGAGGFGLAGSSNAGSRLDVVVASDMNKDGIVDVVGLTTATGGTVVLRGSGAGTFTRAAAPATPPLRRVLLAGDFNADGLPDVLGFDTDPANQRLTYVLGNQAPVGVPDSYNFVQGMPGGPTSPLAGVLANDSDPNRNPVTAVLVVGPAHGTLINFYPSGTFSYYSLDSFTGVDTITYVVSDGVLQSAPITITLNVAGRNHEPWVGSAGLGMGEDGPPAAIQLYASDSDGDAVTFVIVSPPAHGTLTVDPGGAGTYTPFPDYFGPDGFTYRATDGSAWSDIGHFNINVGARPDAPRATAVTTPLTAYEGVALGGRVSGTDVDGDGLTFGVATAPAHGTLSIAADGSFVYTAAVGYFGADEFSFVAGDGLFVSAPATVSLDVLPAEQAPGAVGDSYSIGRGGTATGNVLDNDVPLDEDTTFTAVLVSAPAHGRLTLSPDGSFTYTADPAFAGTETFTYAANDGQGTGAPATVKIRVDTNWAPTAPDLAAEREPGDYAMPIDAEMWDADDEALTLTVASSPEFGDAYVDDNGTADPSDDSLVYVAPPGFYGVDHFTYTVTDGHGNSATGAVTVTTVGAGFDESPIDPSRRDLVVVGTPGPDVIRVKRGPGSKMTVWLNGHSQGAFPMPSSGVVRVFGLDGNDRIEGSGIRARLEARGGGGDDTIFGSATHDFLMGGPGNDLLYGGAGRDVLIGGQGRDYLRGDAGADLVIGGGTVYDADDEAGTLDPDAAISRASLLAAWSAAGRYDEKLAALSAEGGALATGVVVNDSDRDVLFGGGDYDWLFGDTAIDTLPDRRTGESVS
jgi:VCBS repeat-containing protein